MTVEEALAQAERALTEAGVDTPRVDAELLLGHVARTTRSQLALDRRRELAKAEAAELQTLLARRRAREPLAYVLGEWGFRRLTLKTDRRAFVPRPETEMLVDRCLALIRETKSPRVLDVGVGGGAIALALADEHPGARVTAVDTSWEALALARENSERTGLEIELRRADFAAAAEGWDLVVSNPPYVDPAELATLQPEIRDWEPHTALAGIGLHEQLARLAQTSWLVLEVGDGQARAVEAALQRLEYRETRISPDLAGRDRVVEGRRSKA